MSDTTERSSTDRSSTERSSRPQLRQVVLDTEDARKLAEFYRRLLGLSYVDDDGAADADWLVLGDEHGARVLAFQEVESMPAPTWPEGPRPQMMHLDFSVPSAEALLEQRARAVELGAGILTDAADDPEEPIVIFSDPAGHPFCIFVPAE